MATGFAAAFCFSPGVTAIWVQLQPLGVEPGLF